MRQEGSYVITLTLFLLSISLSQHTNTFGFSNQSPTSTHAKKTTSQKDQQNQRLFELDNGKFSVLGTKKAKKRIINAERHTKLEIKKLEQDHTALKKQTLSLEKPNRHAEEIDLKCLKRKKLAVKDAIASLRSQLNHHHHDADSSSSSDVVGSGGFADVYLGHELIVTGCGAEQTEPVAVKISRSPKNNGALLQEAKLIQSLHLYPGFVRVRHVEEVVAEEQKEPQVAVVLDLLGPSIEALWWQCTCGAGGLSAITVLRIANGMLHRLHDMAKMNISHRDIQPANILMGRLNGKSRDTPHLIDFGIAATCSGTGASDETILSTTPPQHAFSGTPRFSSVSALSKHGGGSLPAADLESLCYTLAFLRTGTVPWPKQAENDAMSSSKGALALANLKATTKSKYICGKDFVDDPAAKAISLLLEHARMCCSRGDDETEMPDYGKCQSIVRDILHAQFDAKDRIAPPDWEVGMITWSTENGVLQNTLYN